MSEDGDPDWKRGRREDLLVAVETLKKGDRFINYYGCSLTYERADGAGPGATHHGMGDNGRVYLAGWARVLKLEVCPNHSNVVGLPWAACPICENST